MFTVTVAASVNVALMNPEVCTRFSVQCGFQQLECRAVGSTTLSVWRVTGKRKQGSEKLSCFVVFVCGCWEFEQFSTSLSDSNRCYYNK